MNFFLASLLGNGGDHTMGVRPEDLFISEDGPLSVHVSHVEHLGGDTNVITHVDNYQITARLFGQHQVTAGEDLRLGFQPGKAYAFDQNGIRLQ